MLVVSILPMMKTITTLRQPHHVNPIDKITELYERLLKADQEKIKELEQRIAELEGNASKS